MKKSAAITRGMAEQGSKDLKILILEDVPGDAKLMEMELQSEGLAFTATRVDSKEAFRQALSNSPPDLILADYSLPAFSGLDALKEVRGQCPEVPMIFVSGYINEEEAIDVVRMGATDYVLKQRLTRLAPAVWRAIREAEDRRRRRQAEHKHRRSEEQAQRHLRSLNQLIAGVGKLAKIRDPDAMIQEICQLVVEDFEARLAWLGRAEPDGRVRPLWWAGETADYLNDIEVRWDETPRGQGPTGQAIRSGQPVVFRDLAAEATFAPWRDAALARGYRTSAAIPLRSDHHTFGALMVYSEQADFFRPERVELLQAYARIAAAALENARLNKEAEQRLRQLDALRIIDLAVISSLDLRVTLNVFLDQLTGQLGVDAALVLLLNPQTRSLEYGADRGFKAEGLKKVKLALNQGFAGRVVREQRLLHIPHLAETGKDFALAKILAREEFRAAYVVPLLSKGQVNGVLEIFNRTAFPEDAEWLEFLVDLAGQAAIGIDNDSLFNGLQRSHAEMVRAYEATLEGWAKALDLRDGDTKGHSERVVDLTLSTARALGVPEEELVHFRRGALLHDIGKICVPDHILLKPGPLSQEEWVIMRRHPVYAREWLSPISYLEPALDIPYCHHERWDGSGYPQGLKGEDIPLAARIFAVVDVWEALTSDRPYRAAWPRERAIAHLREQTGKHFDPRVAEAFLEKVIMAEPAAEAR
jgi:response regulator RpfG family c-di-GMP phosphodiesterase/putative methionine-R-sulfoxide reductase with GAF domain